MLPPGFLLYVQVPAENSVVSSKSPAEGLDNCCWYNRSSTLNKGSVVVWQFTCILLKQKC